jgi:phosphoglycolate phosphatase
MAFKIIAMGKEMKKIILFDLDGTLIDSTEAILESFYHSLGTHNEIDNVTDEMILAQIGHPLQTMFASVGINDVSIEKHVATYKLYYREISCAKTFMLPNAVEAIREASQFARLGVVTTKTGHYSRELLEHFGVMSYFEVLVGFENVTNPKPHAEPILTALKQMAAGVEDVWMIGDTTLDLEASLNAGVNAVGVLSGYHNHKQLSSFNFIIVQNSLEAIRHIAKEG